MIKPTSKYLPKYPYKLLLIDDEANYSNQIKKMHEFKSLSELIPQWQKYRRNKKLIDTHYKLTIMHNDNTIITHRFNHSPNSPHYVPDVDTQIFKKTLLSLCLHSAKHPL